MFQHFSRIVVSLVIIASTALIANTPARGQIEEGFFTDEQANRGRQLYLQHCANCHGVELHSGGAPALRGSGILERWTAPDLTLEDILHIQRTTMPPGAVDALTAQEQADVLAFLLARNGVASGMIPLLADSPRLKEMRLSPIPSSDPTGFVPGPKFIEGSPTAARTSGGPTQAELTAADRSTESWLHHTHNYAGTRYVALDQIKVENAHRLQAVCAYQVGEMNTFQTGPIVYEGVLYITTDWVTVALDATTCVPLWRHRWERQDVDVWNNNRGVAIKEGRLVRGTTDGYLLSLNARTGELIWARQVADPNQGETFTMAPVIFEDLILIGPAGSENKIMGWVGAFRLSDGSPVWRFNTVPRPGEPGSETWQNASDFPVGGGAVWTPFSLDPEAGELFIPVTNPAPDLPAHLRPGANLYTNSLVVLDVRTGKLRWYRQLVPNDSHDYDLTQVSPLLTLQSDGQKRQVVVTVGKDGLLRTLDRTSHEILYETPVTTIKNADIPVTTEGIHACPGVLGGVEWNGPAYNPTTNLLYVPAVDWCSFFKAAADLRFIPGRSYFGGSAKRDREKQGWLTALDAGTGEVRWRYRSAKPMVAAVTTTAGQVVLSGDLDGYFLVLDATSGELLYRFNTGGAIGGGVATYEVHGKQYIAVATGLPSRFWVEEHPGAPTLFLFALGESPRTGS